jgi:hypothetical protein
MNYRIKSLLTLITFLIPVTATIAQQLGGISPFSFVDLPSGARTAGTGGLLITVKDTDGSLAHNNPSLLNKSMHANLSVQHTFYVADISHSLANYIHHFKKQDFTTSAAVQYMNYGSAPATDPAGNINGTFSANSFILQVGAAKQITPKTSVGANLKYLGSRLESYNSAAIATDLAATYTDTASRIVVGVVLKNIGYQFATFTGTNESVPFDLQIGFSHRLKHLPFRFHITGHHLTQWNVKYDDPNDPNNQVNLLGEQPATDPIGNFADNMFQHLIFGGELLFGKKENFRLMFGYNHRRRQELKVSTAPSLTGFAFGFGLKISKFRLDYGYGAYHLNGGIHSLGISTNITAFTKKG